MPVTRDQDEVLLFFTLFGLMPEPDCLGHNMLNVLWVQSVDHIEEKLSVQRFRFWAVIRQELSQLLILKRMLH